MISVAALEEAVLTLLVHSNEVCTKLALKIKDDIFSTRVNAVIGKAALDYIKKYSCAPEGQIEYLLEAELRRGEEGKLIGRILGTLKKQAPSIHIPYVLEQLDNFISIQRMTANLQGALEHLQSGELAEAEKLVHRVSSSDIEGTPGIWLSNPGDIFRRSIAKTEYFPCGIPALEHAGVSLDRKTLSFMMASTGKGKSWWLVEVGKSNLQHHHSVLHLTFELSEEKTAKRYLQSIFALTKDEAQTVSVGNFIHGDSGVSINFSTVVREGLLEKKKHISNALSKLLHPKLLIKEFPTGTFSTEQLTMYLDMLEKEKKFKPDVVILDYADLMRLDVQSLRIDTGRLYRDLRGIAMSKDVVVVTASQGNRASESAKVVDLDNAAEDWSKPGTADNVLTYSQTAEEFKRGLARVFAAKVRDGDSRIMALICQNYKIGQFCLDSTIMNAMLREEVTKVTKVDA